MSLDNNDYEKVSVVKCDSYNSDSVKNSLISGLKSINFNFNKNLKVLIKPNVLGPHKPEEAITTNPVILEELCKILKKQKCEIYIGESSSYNTGLSLDVSGISKLSKYAKIVDFEKEPKIFIDIGEVRRVPLPKILFEADMIVNVTKMKTHSLTQVTLCVKNLYGCIPGELKSHYHKTQSSLKKFSMLLLGLEDKIKPGLNIIDGVVGLEGNGPGVLGKPIKSNLLIVSRDAVSADIVASDIMGFKSTSVYPLKFLKNLKKFEVTGDAKGVRVFFEKPSSYLTPFVMYASSFLPKSKIKFNNDKCMKCRLCEQKCPTNSIKLKPYPECDNRSCILCVCCVEVCPHGAVFLEDSPTRRFFKKVYDRIKNNND